MTFPVTWVEASPRRGVPSQYRLSHALPCPASSATATLYRVGIAGQGVAPHPLTVCPACRPTSPSLGWSCPHQHNQCAAWRIPQEPGVSQADGGTEARARQDISITSPFSGRAKLITVFFYLITEKSIPMKATRGEWRKAHPSALSRKSLQSHGPHPRQYHSPPKLPTLLFCLSFCRVLPFLLCWVLVRRWVFFLFCNLSADCVELSGVSLTLLNKALVFLIKPSNSLSH